MKENVDLKQRNFTIELKNFKKVQKDLKKKVFLKNPRIII